MSNEQVIVPYNMPFNNTFYTKYIVLKPAKHSETS